MNQEPWEGVQVENFPARFNISVIKYIVWGFWARRLINQWKPDILHAHRVSSAGWIGAFTGFHPFVVTPWGSDLYSHPYRSTTARILAHKVLEKADLITTDSQDLRKQAIKFGANPEHTTVIGWGVDLEIFYPDHANSQLKENFNILNSFVILSPRGVDPVYNLDIILLAFKKVLKEIPNSTLILRDYNTKQAYKTYLTSMIAQLGIQNSIRWVGELDDWKQVVNLYRLADIVVSVPSSDGTPVSLLESMACGKPVISSDLPSIREWINHDQNGLLVPQRDSDALSQAILALLTNPQKKKKFASYNIPLIQERANHHAEMSKIELLYKNLIDYRI